MLQRRQKKYEDDLNEVITSSQAIEYVCIYFTYIQTCMNSLVIVEIIRYIITTNYGYYGM